MSDSASSLLGTEGPLADLVEKLNGPNGQLWLTNLKRFLRKEIPWVDNDSRNFIVKTLPPVFADGKLYAFAMVEGGNLVPHESRTATTLTEAAIARNFKPVWGSSVHSLVIREFTKNWESHGHEKVTFLFGDKGSQTCDKGVQWTHLPDVAFRSQPAGPPKFGATDKFVFLVEIFKPEFKDD